ncbi:hypothetical protein AtEden1_Chr5g0130251 [Arabidopsis thaliana]
MTAPLQLQQQRILRRAIVCSVVSGEIRLLQNKGYNLTIDVGMRKYLQMKFQNEQVEVEQLPGNEQKADILKNTLGRIKFKEMRDLLGVQDV